jgi:hypothetical protein
VLLGEATHGTHEFYRERARISLRLFAERAFAAVAIEGEWPASFRVNRYVRGTGADPTAGAAAMRKSDRETAVVRRIVRWAEAQAAVRAVVLTSTRARAGASVDALSDHDVILHTSDPAPLLRDGSWTGDLGAVLVQMPPPGQEHAWAYPTRLVLYEDGTRIDFSILPVSVLREAGEAASLPEELDAGYRVLLDKDGLATALPVPSGSAYVLSPPTQEEFAALVEEFWWETGYVAKNQENWRALSRTIALFRTVATEVARQLALEYPHRLDTRMTRYLEQIRTGADPDGVG